MTRIGVPYFLTRYQPDVDLAVRLDVVVRTELVNETGWSPLLPLYESVASAVSDVIAGGGRPTVMSGDCTVALGTVAGLQRAGLDPGVVWFDAHGDVQTMETTASGFLGGMPLRILVGYRPELVAVPLGLRAIAEERVVLVDARDLDPPEKEYLRQSRCGTSRSQTFHLRRCRAARCTSIWTWISLTPPTAGRAVPSSRRPESRGGRRIRAPCLSEPARWSASASRVPGRQDVLEPRVGVLLESVLSGWEQL